MAKDNLSKALCFAGGAVVATVACTRYLARRQDESGSVKVVTLSDDFEQLLDCASISHSDALHAIILRAHKLSVMTDSLQGKIAEAKKVWKELVSRSTDCGRLFSAISQAREIDMNTEPFVLQWKETILETDDARTIFDALRNKLAEKVGINAEPFVQRWSWLIWYGSGGGLSIGINEVGCSKMLTAIERAVAANVDAQPLKDAWKSSMLIASKDVVFDVLNRNLAEMIDVDAEPLKDHWMALILGSSSMFEIFTAIHQAGTIGVDETPIKDYWLETALKSSGVSGMYAVFQAIPQAVQIGIDPQSLKDLWKDLFFQAAQHSTVAEIVDRFSDFAEVGIDNVSKERIMACVLERLRELELGGDTGSVSRDLVQAMPYISKFCATPTGKIVMGQASASDADLEISCQLLSGKIVFRASLPLDTTVSILENSIKKEMGWESLHCVDTFSNSGVSGHSLLSACSDLVIQELALCDFGLKKLWTSLIQLRMDSRNRSRVSSTVYAENLAALLTDRSHLRNNGIDVIQIESLRDWISSAISTVENIFDLNLLSELVADVPCWQSAFATQAKVLETRTQLCQSLLSKPSVGTWMTPLVLTRHKRGPIQQRHFMVTLRKTLANSRLGLTVDIANSVCMIVDKINGGMLHEWNCRHPEWEVRSGDRVLEVNGISGDAVELTQVCKTDDVLHMKIYRGMNDGSDMQE